MLSVQHNLFSCRGQSAVSGHRRQTRIRVLLKRPTVATWHRKDSNLQPFTKLHQNNKQFITNYNSRRSFSDVFQILLKTGYVSCMLNHFTVFQGLKIAHCRCNCAQFKPGILKTHACKSWKHVPYVYNTSGELRLDLQPQLAYQTVCHRG